MKLVIAGFVLLQSVLLMDSACSGMYVREKLPNSNPEDVLLEYPTPHAWCYVNRYPPYSMSCVPR